MLTGLDADSSSFYTVLTNWCQHPPKQHSVTHEVMNRICLNKIEPCSSAWSCWSNMLRVLVQLIGSWLSQSSYQIHVLAQWKFTQVAGLHCKEKTIICRDILHAGIISRSINFQWGHRIKKAKIEVSVVWFTIKYLEFPFHNQMPSIWPQVAEVVRKYSNIYQLICIQTWTGMWLVEQ